ncbi:MAG: YfiR family protein [Opitutaceae bacterium]
MHANRSLRFLLVSRTGLLTRGFGFLACLALGPANHGSGAPAADSSLEYQIKGAYLYNFTRFVDWPKAFADAADTIRVGVIHQDAQAAAAIVDTIDGKITSSGKTLAVDTFTTLDPSLQDYQIIFVTRSAALEAPELRALIENRPVLLVGETSGFATRGGTISLVLASSTVRCEINLKRAESAGLKLSGRLSSVARLVRDAPRF